MTPLHDIVEALLSWRRWDSRSYWLAEMVVRIVEEKTELLAVTACDFYGCCKHGKDWKKFHLPEALRDIDITPDDFARLKGKVGE